MSSHWKSRRLASRSKKVQARHSDKPSIAAYGGSLNPKADAFITAYDTAARYEATWRKEMAEGKGAMGALSSAMNEWKPHVARERPGFDVTTIGDRPTVPEDLIEDGVALADQLDLVAQPWATDGAASVRVKATDAERETDEAAAADATHNEQLAAVRDAKVEFDAELARFRSTLRAALGSSHPDYQKLRADRAATADADDDPAAPQPSPSVTPAPVPPIA